MTPWAVIIFTGGLMGLVMWANVWFVIWPNQKIIIANAIATAGGAAANPVAAPAARRAALASRTNTLFSIPMLFFMGAASHYPNLVGQITPGGVDAWLVVTLVILALVEANALIGTQGPTKKPLDSISGTIHSGLGLWLILMIVIWATLR
jgi:uncharacterized membrane protein